MANSRFTRPQVIKRQTRKRAFLMLTEQARFSLVMISINVQNLMDSPKSWRHQNSANKQRLKYTNKKRGLLQVALTHSENVFLNFHTLGAATAKQ